MLDPPQNSITEVNIEQQLQQNMRQFNQQNSRNIRQIRDQPKVNINLATIANVRNAMFEIGCDRGKALKQYDGINHIIEVLNYIEYQIQTECTEEELKKIADDESEIKENREPNDDPMAGQGT